MSDPGVTPVSDHLYIQYQDYINSAWWLWQLTVDFG